MTISILTKDDFSPKTADEAGRAFGERIALTSEAFESLSAEARQRAFRIAGLHKAKLVQHARNIVHQAVKKGTPYSEVRRELMALFDTKGLPRPSLGGLRIAFRQTTMHAYSVGRTRTLKQPHIIEAFPYWQYLTVGNGRPGANRVRATHAALHGLIFRADDSFWDKFDPPWEFGCRCFKRALTPGQVKRMGIKVRDEKYVRRQLRVPGERGKGIDPHPGFAFPRDSFDGDKFDLTKLDAELRRAVEEMMR